MTNDSFMMYAHALSCVSGIGAKTLTALTKASHPETIWKEPHHSALATFPMKIKEAFDIARRSFDVTKQWQEMRDSGIECVWYESENYPALLKEIPDFPPLLYVRGNLQVAIDYPCVSVIGTRKPTSYGKQVAWSLSGDIARSGATIVSGLALGLDSTAHEAAIESGGFTLAVLGSGLAENNIAPRSHLQLAQRIVRGGGAVISEYPPHIPASAGTFPARNRIIAGLSCATIVIEAARESGTLITARLALEYNREVFAVPGSIFSQASEGANHLLSQGAQVASNASNILDSLAISFKKTINTKDSETLTTRESTIYSILKNEPVTVDALARQTGETVASISAALSMMELRGIVKNFGGGKYGVL